MKLNTRLFLAIALATGLAACRPSIDVTPAGSTSGKADFSHYISIGNSLTAGYADGGLYLEGQQNSYPSILARQMKAVGGGDFSQPLFTEAQSNGSGYLKLTGFDSSGNPITAPVTSNLAVRGVTTIPGFGNVTLYTKYSGDISNYGVPGIKLLHITLASYGNLNGYYERMLTGNAGTNTTPYLDFVTSKSFTFFSNWLGNNDDLGYATSGGAGDVLTDKATFTQLYTLLISRMTANGAKGVCATIPDVTAIPYFNTVTPALILSKVQKANPTVAALYVSAKTNGNVADTTHAARVATSADHIILTFPTALIGSIVTTSAGPLPYGLTPLTPIDNKYVLDSAETAIAQDYVASYNTSIKSIAGASGLAVADMYTFLNNVKAKGLLQDGISMSASYISGGLFSLDGVHLTPRGYAVVANEFIKAINAQYGAAIPLTSIAGYRGVKFP